MRIFPWLPKLTSFGDKPACDNCKRFGEDCDLCGYDDEDPEEVNYTATRNTDRIQAQPMRWEEFDDDL